MRTYLLLPVRIFFYSADSSQCNKKKRNTVLSMKKICLFEDDRTVYV